MSAESLLAELERRIEEIAQSEPERAGPIWGIVHKLLLKATADPGEVAGIVATRDLDALRRIVLARCGPDRSETNPHPTEAAARPDAISDETLKKALRAFRRRIKLVRLDHESRLGVGPMTSGRKADFDAILPPREFPPQVWEALVAVGRLRRAGQGFYMLPDTGRG